ncbi:MAG TPA: acyl-CoA desaturase [Drouetiella sp.]
MFNWVKFLDSDYFPAGAEAVRNQPKVSTPSRWIPFVILHVACLSVLLTGVSTAALVMCVSFCLLRMLAITSFYHRYFSHRTYKTSRIAQFVFAVAGLTAVQRGPLWWASHHRHHHQHADKEKDIHSPTMRGFLWSHIGWITADSNMPTDYSRVPDFARYPELVFVNRFDWIVPILSAVSIYALGAVLGASFPNLHTNGPQFLAWGIVSTVAAFHATAAINSLAHQFGSQEFETNDDSKNSFLLGLICLGEGWHNNHHRYPGCVRQGLEWWQIDITYYYLLMLEACGVIWDLNKTPVLVSTSNSKASEELATKSNADLATKSNADLATKSSEDLVIRKVVDSESGIVNDNERIGIPRIQAAIEGPSQ